jgi:hypothetical protein
MLDRRHFLIGVGSLLTAPFVRKATAFSQALREPLILPPPRRPEETLYIYVKDWIDYEANDDEAKWRVTLGHDEPVAPPVPTWRDYLHRLGHHLDTNDDIARAYPAQPRRGGTRHFSRRLLVGGPLGQFHRPSGEGISYP